MSFAILAIAVVVLIINEAIMIWMLAKEGKTITNLEKRLYRLEKAEMDLENALSLDAMVDPKRTT